MSEARFAVAVAGAGPAGLYAARKLADAGCRVVLFNRDIRPGGLAEYGIFHDKYKMKAGLRKTFAKILEHENISYRGNVSIGDEGALQLDELDELGFDGVLWATGAQGIKFLHIPGSTTTKGVYDSKELVFNYNGLPPYSMQAMPLGEKVLIIGAGNVAVDITHWAVQQGVKEVQWLVRRGPNQVKYTPKELGYMGGHVDREAMRDEIQRLAPVLSELGEDPTETLSTLLDSLGDTRIEGSSTTIRMRFACQVTEVLGDEDKVLTSVLVMENALRKEEERVVTSPTEQIVEMKTDSLVFCVGDMVDPSVGLALDEWGGYAMDEDAEGSAYAVRGRPGWFGAGWARLASDGLVGKARKDGQAAAEKLLAWLQQEPPRQAKGMQIERVDGLFEERDVVAISWNDFKRIQAKEDAIALEREDPGFRFRSPAQLLAAAQLKKR